MGRANAIVAELPEQVGSSSYRAPTQWRTYILRDLLAGTSRALPPGVQVDMLDAQRVGQGAADTPIYTVGDTRLLRLPCASVVGTRNVSVEGAARARRVARELVEAGVVVVSGLADGVDAQAMSSAISNGGRTIGVIGTPLDKAYPASNAGLQEAVYREHLLISQFAHGARTYRSSFPARNRLMALLSDATIIVEASDSSGTLHQAAECMKIGRWLFIAKSVVENPRLTWPARFNRHEKCVTFSNTRDIIDRIC